MVDTKAQHRGVTMLLPSLPALPSGYCEEASQPGLSPCDADTWQDLEAYVVSIRPPSAESDDDEADEERQDRHGARLRGL